MANYTVLDPNNNPIYHAYVVQTFNCNQIGSITPVRTTTQGYTDQNGELSLPNNCVEGGFGTYTISAPGFKTVSGNYVQEPFGTNYLTINMQYASGNTSSSTSGTTWSVSLTSSASDILTATANQPMENSGYYLVIFDQTSSTPVNYTSVASSVQAVGSAGHTYYAYIGSLQGEQGAVAISNPITISSTGAGSGGGEGGSGIGANGLQLMLSASPQSGNAPLTVNFSVESIGGVPPVTYNFDYGDGSSSGSTSSPTATHTYTTAGTYYPIATVTDSTGASVSTPQSLTITVNGSSFGSLTDIFVIIVAVAILAVITFILFHHFRGE